MGRVKRLRKNKKRGMLKRKGKKPMSEEQKAERKKAREEQRVASLKLNEAQAKKNVKVVKKE